MFLYIKFSIEAGEKRLSHWNLTHSYEYLSEKTNILGKSGHSDIYFIAIEH